METKETVQAKRKFDSEDQKNGAWVKRIKRHKCNELDQCLKQLGECLCKEGANDVTQIDSYKLVGIATKVISNMSTSQK